MTQLKDPYNVTIEVGDKVAYNYQGQVRLGRVHEIKEKRGRNFREFMNSPTYVIVVKEEMTGDYSKVTSPNNMVVIGEQST